jgi:hypothetical protein
MLRWRCARCCRSRQLKESESERGDTAGVLPAIEDVCLDFDWGPVNQPDVLDVERRFWDAEGNAVHHDGGTCDAESGLQRTLASRSTFDGE